MWFFRRAAGVGACLSVACAAQAKLQTGNGDSNGASRENPDSSSRKNPSEKNESASSSPSKSELKSIKSKLEPQTPQSPPHYKRRLRSRGDRARLAQRKEGSSREEGSNNGSSSQQREGSKERGNKSHESQSGSGNKENEESDEDPFLTALLGIQEKLEGNETSKIVDGKKEEKVNDKSPKVQNRKFGGSLGKTHASASARVATAKAPADKVQSKINADTKRNYRSMGTYANTKQTVTHKSCTQAQPQFISPAQEPQAPPKKTEIINTLSQLSAQENGTKRVITHATDSKLQNKKSTLQKNLKLQVLKNSKQSKSQNLTPPGGFDWLKCTKKHGKKVCRSWWVIRDPILMRKYGGEKLLDPDSDFECCKMPAGKCGARKYGGRKVTCEDAPDDLEPSDADDEEAHESEQGDEPIEEKIEFSDAPMNNSSVAPVDKPTAPVKSTAPVADNSSLRSASKTGRLSTTAIQDKRQSQTGVSGVPQNSMVRNQEASPREPSPASGGSQQKKKHAQPPQPSQVVQKTSSPKVDYPQLRPQIDPQHPHGNSSGSNVSSPAPQQAQRLTRAQTRIIMAQKFKGSEAPTVANSRQKKVVIASSDSQNISSDHAAPQAPVVDENNTNHNFQSPKNIMIRKKGGSLCLNPSERNMSNAPVNQNFGTEVRRQQLENSTPTASRQQSTQPSLAPTAQQEIPTSSKIQPGVPTAAVDSGTLTVDGRKIKPRVKTSLLTLTQKKNIVEKQQKLKSVERELEEISQKLANLENELDTANNMPLEKEKESLESSRARKERHRASLQRQIREASGGVRSVKPPEFASLPAGPAPHINVAQQLMPSSNLSNQVSFPPMQLTPPQFPGGITIESSQIISQPPKKAHRTMSMTAEQREREREKEAKKEAYNLVVATGRLKETILFHEETMRRKSQLGQFRTELHEVESHVAPVTPFEQARDFISILVQKMLQEAVKKVLLPKIQHVIKSESGPSFGSSEEADRRVVTSMESCNFHNYSGELQDIWDSDADNSDSGESQSAPEFVSTSKATVMQLLENVEIFKESIVLSKINAELAEDKAIEAVTSARHKSLGDDLVARTLSILRDRMRLFNSAMMEDSYDSEYQSDSRSQENAAPFELEALVEGDLSEVIKTLADVALGDKKAEEEAANREGKTEEEKPEKKGKEKKLRISGKVGQELTRLLEEGEADRNGRRKSNQMTEEQTTNEARAAIEYQYERPASIEARKLVRNLVEPMIVRAVTKIMVPELGKLAEARKLGEHVDMVTDNIKTMFLNVLDRAAKIWMGVEKDDGDGPDAHKSVSAYLEQAEVLKNVFLQQLASPKDARRLWTENHTAIDAVEHVLGMTMELLEQLMREFDVKAFHPNHAPVTTSASAAEPELKDQLPSLLKDALPQEHRLALKEAVFNEMKRIANTGLTEMQNVGGLRFDALTEKKVHPLMISSEGRAVAGGEHVRFLGDLGTDAKVFILHGKVTFGGIACSRNFCAKVLVPASTQFQKRQNSAFKGFNPLQSSNFLRSQSNSPSRTEEAEKPQMQWLLISAEFLRAGVSIEVSAQGEVRWIAGDQLIRNSVHPSESVEKINVEESGSEVNPAARGLVVKVIKTPAFFTSPMTEARPGKQKEAVTEVMIQLRHADIRKSGVIFIFADAVQLTDPCRDRLTLHLDAGVVLEELTVGEGGVVRVEPLKISPSSTLPSSITIDNTITNTINTGMQFPGSDQQPVLFKNLRVQKGGELILAGDVKNHAGFIPSPSIAVDDGGIARIGGRIQGTIGQQAHLLQNDVDTALAPVAQFSFASSLPGVHVTVKKGGKLQVDGGIEEYLDTRGFESGAKLELGEVVATRSYPVRNTELAVYNDVEVEIRGKFSEFARIDVDEGRLKFHNPRQIDDGAGLRVQHAPYHAPFLRELCRGQTLQISKNAEGKSQARWLADDKISFPERNDANKHHPNSSSSNNYKPQRVVVMKAPAIFHETVTMNKLGARYYNEALRLLWRHRIRRMTALVNKDVAMLNVALPRLDRVSPNFADKMTFTQPIRGRHYLVQEGVELAAGSQGGNSGSQKESGNSGRQEEQKESDDGHGDSDSIIVGSGGVLELGYSRLVRRQRLIQKVMHEKMKEDNFVSQLKTGLSFVIRKGTSQQSRHGMRDLLGKIEKIRAINVADSDREGLEDLEVAGAKSELLKTLLVRRKQRNGLGLAREILGIKQADEQSAVAGPARSAAEPKQESKQSPLAAIMPKQSREPALPISDEEVSAEVSNPQVTASKDSNPPVCHSDELSNATKPVEIIVKSGGKLKINGPITYTERSNGGSIQQHNTLLCLTVVVESGGQLEIDSNVEGVVAMVHVGGSVNGGEVEEKGKYEYPLK